MSVLHTFLANLKVQLKKRNIFTYQFAIKRGIQNNRILTYGRLKVNICKLKKK